VRANSKKVIAKFLAILLSVSLLLIADTASANNPAVALPSFFNATASFATVNGVSVSNYAGTVQATISVASGNVKIGTTTGLTQPTGYSSADWTSNTATVISFSGTQTNVNSALATLQYKANTIGTADTITVATFVSGGAYDPSSGRIYEIVNNGSAITWELARCKAKYSNSDVYLTAGVSLRANDRCASSTTLTRKTSGGLKGYLANITSLEEHQFLMTKLSGVGMIGGADMDSEGTFIWMDGPESGQVFFTPGQSSRRGSFTVSGSVAGFSYGTNRFNYFSDGEPNNASEEDFVEFGFGNQGVGSSWNDCRNGCNRTNYIIEYGGEAGDTLQGASGTIPVRTAPTAPTSVSPSAGELQATLSWTAPTSVGGTPITGYFVEYKASGGSWVTATSNTASASTSYTVTGLLGATTYTFRVSAINAAGTSSVSTESSGVTVRKLTQTVTWAPTTSALVRQSPLTPSSLATALDGAIISYSVTSAGITSCAVNSSTGVLTYNAPGVCIVRASAAETTNYATATRDVTFTITSITLQPENDTTTAGLVDSFTITTVAAPAGLTRVIKWQVATDTVTAVASVSWTDVTSGSGATTGIGFTTETFTTNTLATSMNKYRYRAIVTFTGSGGTSIETSTVATLTINPAISITSTQTAITTKYGAGGTTRTVTFTGGTDTRTVSASATSLANGKITFDTSTARFTIDTRTAVGTYLDTITITDAKGATASYVQTIIFTVADTLTVTSDTPTALTYTGSAANVNPTISAVSGLVTGDVISGATFNYSASILSCANGGPCSIGEVGPGGGLVFITPTTAGNNTGKYFEAAPSGWSGSAADPVAALCTNPTTVDGASGAGIGTGETNTNLFANSAACGASAADTATALVLGGRDDWFLPSFDELKEMFSKLHKAAGGALGGFATAADNYLSSSDNPNGVAPAGADYALYGWFGSSDGIVGWGSSSKTNPFAYRPVRSFLATSTSTVNYGPSETKPTNASTYTITPSALTFSDGALSNYAAVTYRTSTLTINKAAQAALSVVPLYLPFNGNPTSATLLTTGGSDTGTVTYAYVSSLSTAGGCALSGADSSTITVTSDGTCRIVATKAATNNFLVAISDTGTVTFHLYVTNIPAPRAAEYPTEIVLSGATAMTNNGLAPTITFTGADISAAAGSSFTIAGSGFVGTRLVRVSGVSAAFTVLSDTSLRITMPNGLTGISGPIYVEKAEGSRASEDWVVGVATVTV
jgi:Fibronectin type III domain